jgi:hypothetical protein
MNQKQREQLLRRATELEARGDNIESQIALHPELAARYGFHDDVADLTDDLAQLRADVSLVDV